MIKIHYRAAQCDIGLRLSRVCYWGLSYWFEENPWLSVPDLYKGSEVR